MIGMNSTVYKIAKTVHTLYDAVPSASPLALAAAPTGNFRCMVTLAASGDHTDCSGTITVGTETLTFTAAGAKFTTILLAALPAVTYSNLDCNITITCLDSQGQPIYSTVATLLNSAGWFASGKLIQVAANQWDQSTAFVLTDDITLKQGDWVRYDGENYQIKKAEVHSNLPVLPARAKLYV